MKKRLTALAMLTAVLFYLLGCAVPDASPLVGEFSPEAPGEAGTYDTHVVLSTNITDADRMGSDALYEYICEKCQTHLDPGERCDCELEKERERASKKSVKMIYSGSIKSRAKGRRTYAL